MNKKKRNNVFAKLQLQLSSSLRVSRLSLNKNYSSEIRIQRATHPLDKWKSFFHTMYPYSTNFEELNPGRIRKCIHRGRNKRSYFQFSLYSSTKEGSIPRATTSNLDQESRSRTCFPISNPSSRKIGSQKGLDSRTFHDIVGPRLSGPSHDLSTMIRSGISAVCWNRLVWWNKEWKIYGEILKRIREEGFKKCWSIFLH